MNRIHRIVWNEAQGAWVAVTEVAKGRGPRALLSARSLRRMGLAALAATGAAALAAPPTPAAPAPTALPTGGQVVAGQAGISQNGATLTVQQASQRAAIDWQRFDIGRDATVRFAQPGRDAVTLNRVLDNQPSRIFGRIQADGQVFLSNPSGVYFAPGASADVGGLVATTMAIGVDDFMAGGTTFGRDGSTGAVVNEGTLQARYGGYIALLAPEVVNSGLVMAQAGTVALAAGEAVELQFAGGQLAKLRVEPATVAALIENRQAVQAPDGVILMSARAAQAIGGSVIRHSGEMAADSLQAQGGRIVLEADRIELATGSRTSAAGATGGGDIRIGGDWQGQGNTYQAREVLLAAGASVDASATDRGHGGSVVLWSDIHHADSRTGVFGNIAAKGGAQGGDGGRIETSGHAITISGSSVNASAAKGLGGEWLIDPYDMTISSNAVVNNSNWTSTGTGSNMYVNDLIGQLNNGTSITVSTGSSGSEPGTITVNADINKTTGGDATLTLKAADAIFVNSNIANSSSAGKLNVVLWSDADGSGAGNIKLTNADITTGGGHVWMGGGAGNSVFQGLTVGNAAAIGTRGIELSSASSVVTGAGSISMTGTGTGSGSGAYGVLITGGSLVETSTGSIDLLGRGSTTVGTGNNKEGVTLSGSSTVRISGGSGNLTVTGYGGNGGSGNYNIGVNATGTSVLEMGASATGAMNITGTGGSGATGQWGVLVEGGSKYQSLGAASITLTGHGGSGTDSQAIRGNGSGSVIGHANMTGDITLLGDSLYLGNSGSDTRVISSGQLRLDTTTATRNISVGTALSNSLNINGNHFNSHFSQNLSRVVLGGASRAAGGSVILDGTVFLSTANDLEINAGSGAITQNAGSSFNSGNYLLVLGSDLAFNQATTGTTRINGSQVLLRGNGDFTLTNAANTITTLAADNGSGAVQLVNSGALSVGSVGSVNGIQRGGRIDLRTASGDLSVTQSITTASSSDTALVLASGTSAAAGTATGGNVLISGAGSLSTDPAGRALIYTGSLSGSTGVTEAVGSGSGRFRYGSNLATTAYTSALDSTGVHAIYRERPTLSGSYDSQTQTYGAAMSAFTATAVGGSLRNGDALSNALAGAATQLGNASYSSSGQLNAGSYTIGLAQPAATATALGYDLSGVTAGTVTVTPASISPISGITAQHKVYDGLTTASLDLSGAQLQGMAVGDDLSLASASGQFADKNVGQGKAVTITGLTLAGADAGNYVLASSSASTTASITPARISVSGITAQDRVYNGSTVATVNTSGAQLQGLVNGDSLTVANASGRFADKNVGQGKTVTITGVVLVGDDLANYVLANGSSTTTASITPATLTAVTGVTAQGKVYDGNTNATLDTTGAQFQGLLAGDVLSVAQASGRFADRNVGRNKAVAITDISLGGTDAGNYVLASTTGSTTASITPAQLTAVSGITAQDKVYDAGTAATVSTGAAQLQGVLGTDTVLVASATGRFADKNVASGKTVTVSDVALGGADAGNYVLAGNATIAATSASITPAALSVAGSISARSRVEDGSTNAQVDLSGVSLAGVASGDTVTLSTGPARFDSAQQGNGRTVTVAGLALAGADAANYRLTTERLTTTADLYAAPPLTTPVLPPVVVPTPPVSVPAGLPAPVQVTAATPAPVPMGGSAAAGSTPSTAAAAADSAAPAAPATTAGAAAPAATTAAPGGGNGGAASTGSVASAGAAPAQPATSGGGTGSGNAAGTILVGSGTNVQPSGGFSAGAGAGGGGAGALSAPAPAAPSGATPAPQGAGGTPSIAVQLVQAPGAGGSGLVTVSVPQEVLRSGNGFSFPLPDALQQPISNGATVSVSQADGQPLPAWLRFDAASGRFSGQQVPQGGLPLQVQLVVNGQRTVMSINPSN